MKLNLRTFLSKLLSVFTAAALLATLPSLVPTQIVSAAGIVGTITRIPSHGSCPGYDKESPVRF
jgi:hypothetical protein